MHSKVEKTISYIVGGVAGLAIWIVSMSLPEITLEESHNGIISVLSIVIGVLVASTIIEYKEQKQAKKDNKVRNETVALITHEMRTALTSTSWGIQSVLNNYESVLKEEDKKMLEDLVKSTHTTVMHTVNLLDVSLLDIGKLAIALEWVDLEKVDEMVREIVERYEMGAKKDNVDLRSDISLNKEMKVEVDLLRLRIVIENLIENALQYINLSNKKEIKIAVKNDDKYLQINVSDTGIGIPLSEQDKIFKEFFRASNARKKLSSGSGIGLYMCQQYIKSHRGTIRFESEEGKGTTFFITIPLKSSENVKEFLETI